jgi:hypothetical protein
MTPKIPMMNNARCVPVNRSDPDRRCISTTSRDESEVFLFKLVFGLVRIVKA